jgi:DNA-binding response OmpR family regulator
VRRPIRVLVVEGDHDAASTVADLLESQGHEVRCAENAAQARSLLRRVHPDLVILELVLPDADATCPSSSAAGPPAAGTACWG